MTRALFLTTAYRRDLKLAKKRKINLDSLEASIEKICNRGENEYLPTQHKLVGQYSDCWEIRLQNDSLLIWRETDDAVTLVRLGRHADVFKE